MSTTLILGGVKSGKSILAENIATNSSFAIHYIATASADDHEMKQRIESHRQRRPMYWQTTEAPIHLAAAIEEHCVTGQCVLVDCLTLWLSNLLMKKDEALLQQEIENLVSCVANIKGSLIMVSNETNMGIVPMGELTRRYCDEVGILHQRIAEQCNNVVLTVAGLPHVLKGHI